MSIFKDTFRPFVRDQLTIREHLISTGNPQNDGETRTLKTSNRNVNLSGERSITLPPGSHYQYTLNKQCGIRLTSLVDYVEDVELQLGASDTFDDLKGATLSQRFILEGGTLSNKSTPRGGIKSPNNESNLAYGDPFLGANGDNNSGFGIVPMPGITDIQIRTKTAYGSLREAKINFECHNRRQLEVLEMLYMRPGYAVLLEWGWMPYIDNSGKVKEKLPLVETEVGLEDGKSKLYGNSIDQQIIFNAINKLKEKTSGNYDACLGFIKNFGFQAREDGGYTCFTEMVTIGEVLESLKAPSISTFSPMFLSGRSNQVTTQNSSSAENPPPQPTADELRAQELTDITPERFNDAVDVGLIPEYNGLEGLTKALKTYTTYNSFTLKSPGETSLGGAILETYTHTSAFGVNSSAIYEVRNPIIDEAIENYTDLYNFEGEDGQLETLLEEQGIPYGRKSGRIRDISRVEIDANVEAQLAFFQGREPGNYRPYTTRWGDGSESRQDLTVKYRKDLVLKLITFRSSLIESTLLKKLNLGDPEQLREYIIPRGPVKFRTEIEDGETYVIGDGYWHDFDFAYRNDQPFIRWDALIVLINDALIPQTENQKAPINVVADRIYNVGGNISRLDPLKYATITKLSDNKSHRVVFDFSTDPNVCILPHQFTSIPQSMVEDQLGYYPNIYNFPKEYLEGLYSSDNILSYNGEELTPGRRLSYEDAQQRIGSIFLNINMIDQIATRNNNNPNYTVGNFISDIWEEVNKVCPNHNFVLTDDKESNSVFIIDLPVDKGNVPSIRDLHEFVPFSNKNILRSFNYTSNVPSSMTSTIAIQAQDPRSIQDIDGVTFAAFNRSIKNRLFSTDIESTFTKTQQQIQDEATALSKKKANLNEQLINFSSDFFSNLSAEANGRAIKGGNITNVLKEFQQLNTYISEAEGVGTSFVSVIPLEFNATLDGISGIVIGNLFKIQKDRLPRAYGKTNIGFIVFNEEQKVTAGGDWTTDISGKMIVLDDPDKITDLPVKYDLIVDPYATGPVNEE